MSPNALKRDAHRAVVEAFYAGIRERDSTGLGTLIDDHFTDDASAEWPDSLPYGGRVDGARRLRKLFMGMAASDQKVGPHGITVVSVSAGAESVAVELAFEWYPPGAGSSVPSRALELWSFDGSKVKGIRAYYWDTAALVAAMA